MCGLGVHCGLPTKGLVASVVRKNSLCLYYVWCHWFKTYILQYSRLNIEVSI